MTARREHLSRHALLPGGRKLQVTLDAVRVHLFDSANGERLHLA